MKLVLNEELQKPREESQRCQLMGCFLEETTSALRVARLEMDTEVVGKENCVERRIDDFGDAINGDQEELSLIHI